MCTGRTESGSDAASELHLHFVQDVDVGIAAELPRVDDEEEAPRLDLVIVDVARDLRLRLPIRRRP